MIGLNEVEIGIDPAGDLEAASYKVLEFPILRFNMLGDFFSNLVQGIFNRNPGCQGKAAREFASSCNDKSSKAIFIFQRGGREVGTSGDMHLACSRPQVLTTADRHSFVSDVAVHRA